MKKDNILTLVALVFLLLGGSLAVYYIYNKILNNATNSEEIVAPMRKSSDISDEEIEKTAYTLLSNTNIFGDMKTGAPKIVDLDNNRKLWLAYNIFIQDFEDKSAEEIEKGLKNIFGSSFTVEFSDIFMPQDSETPIFSFDSTNGHYTSELGFGRTEYEIAKMELMSFERKNYSQNDDREVYLLTYKPLIYPYSGGCETEVSFIDIRDNTIYTYTPEETEKVICFLGDIPENVIEDIYSKSSQSLTSITFEMTYENDNLIIIGFETA